ncbi:hypothetical protein KKA95_01375 [Patescibacteria group bacterium]|nr:hypothetical protein [Patescibacteria group bacterium]
MTEDMKSAAQLALQPSDIAKRREEGLIPPEELNGLEREARRGWANEVRAMMMFALRDSRIWGEQLKTLYNGFDEEKRVAFAESVDISELPQPIYDLLISERGRIEDILIENESLEKDQKHNSVGDWFASQDITPEAIEEGGIRTISRILRNVSSRVNQESPKLLKKQEVSALEIIARNVQNSDIISMLLQITEYHPPIAYAILDNPIFQEKVEGMPEKQQKTLATAIAKVLIQKAKSHLKRIKKDENDYNADVMPNVLRRIYDLHLGVDDEIAGLVQQNPDVAMNFIETDLDIDTIRKLFPVKWLESIASQKNWDGFARKLYGRRYNNGLAKAGAGTGPEVRALEKNPRIR